MERHFLRRRKPLRVWYVRQKRGCRCRYKNDHCAISRGVYSKGNICFKYGFEKGCSLCTECSVSWRTFDISVTTSHNKLHQIDLNSAFDNDSISCWGLFSADFQVDETAYELQYSYTILNTSVDGCFPPTFKLTGPHTSYSIYEKL